MGCDIHIITQIKVNGAWKFVPEIPAKLDNRDYFNFAVLAGVRNSWNIQGFEAKGLPSDLGAMQFGWVSELENIQKDYDSDSEQKCKLPNGKYISSWDDSLKRFCSQEEYAAWKGAKGCTNNSQFYVYDAAQVGGKFVVVPIKELYTWEEYLAEYHQGDYNAELNDYGHYKVDFNCEDYHTPSYLTLQELTGFDYTEVLKDKVKVSKIFVDKFLELGGVLPEGMSLTKNWQPQTIRDCFQEAFEPTCIISWKSDKDSNEIPLFIGIYELEEIAKQYGVQNHEDIRIVFAFDN